MDTLRGPLCWPAASPAFPLHLPSLPPPFPSPGQVGSMGSACLRLCSSRGEWNFNPHATSVLFSTLDRALLHVLLVWPFPRIWSPLQDRLSRCIFRWWLQVKVSVLTFYCCRNFKQGSTSGLLFFTALQGQIFTGSCRPDVSVWPRRQAFPVDLAPDPALKILDKLFLLFGPLSAKE